MLGKSSCLTAFNLCNDNNISIDLDNRSSDLDTQTVLYISVCIIQCTVMTGDICILVPNSEESMVLTFGLILAKIVPKHPMFKRRIEGQ